MSCLGAGLLLLASLSRSINLRVSVGEAASRARIPGGRRSRVQLARNLFRDSNLAKLHFTPQEYGVCLGALPSSGSGGGGWGGGDTSSCGIFLNRGQEIGSRTFVLFICSLSREAGWRSAIVSAAMLLRWLRAQERRLWMDLCVQVHLCGGDRLYLNS